MKNKILKRVLSVVCALTLIITAVYEPSLFGKTNEDVGEVNAAESTQPTTSTDFTELSWVDFGLSYGAQGLDTVGRYTGASSLHRTLLDGDISFGADTQFRFGSNGDGWNGFIIQVTGEGNIALVQNGFSQTNHGEENLNSNGKMFYPADFALTSFANTRLNLKISTEISGSNYTFGIWINNQMLGGYFTLQDASSIGGTHFVMHNSNTTNENRNYTLYQTYDEPETGFTELKWTDFTGLAYQEYTMHTAGAYSVGSLHQTILNDEITFAAGTFLRYGGHDGWQGIFVGVDGNGTFYVNQGQGTYAGALHHQNAEPSDWGVKTFAGTKINLKISTEVSENTHTFGVWVNNKMVGEYFTLPSGELSGATVGLAESGSIILRETYQEANMEFAEITWADFSGLAYQSYTGHTTGTYKGGNSLHRTLLNNDITLSKGSRLRCMGYDGWQGFFIEVNAEGKLVVNSGQGTFAGTSYSKTYEASQFGLTAFSDNKFNLKISTEVYGNNYTFGIWVNNQMLDGYFTLVDNGNCGGACIGVEPLGTISLRQAYKEPKTGFTELSWADFGLSYGAQGTNKEGKYVGANSLHQTILNGDVTFDGATQLRFAANGGWEGFIIYVLADGRIEVSTGGYSAVKSGSENLKIYSASDFHLTSFTDTKLNLKISTEVSGNDYIFGIWINNQMLGGYFTLTDGRSIAGTGLVFYNSDFGNEDVTLFETYEEPNMGFTELGWKDFAPLTYKKYPAISGDLNGAGRYEGASSLHRTMLNGNVTFEANTEIRYAANNGWEGFFVKVNSSGQLVINMGQGIFSSNSYEEVYDASEFGLEGDTFIGEQINVKISTQISGTNYTFGVWINNKPAGGYFTLVNGGIAGTYVGLIDPNYVNSITLNDNIIREKLPTDYTTLRLSDFNIPTGVYTAANGTSSVYGTTTAVPKLDEVILHFNEITFEGDVDLGFSGSNEWLGFKLRSSSNGKLTLMSAYGEFLAGVSMTDEIAGVDVVGGTYDLKISLLYTSETTLQIGVWFENVLYNNQYIMADVSEKTNDRLGCSMGVVSVSGGGTITFGYPSLEDMTLTPITFADFGIPDGGYDFQLDGYRDNALTSLLNTSLRQKVKFVYNGTGDYWFQYGGTEAGSWYGIRFMASGTNLNFAAAGGEFTCESSTLVSSGEMQFLNKEFELGIDLVQDASDVLMYVYYNGELYNNTPFRLKGFMNSETALSNSIVFYPSRSGDCLVVGDDNQILPAVYHNVEDGAYTAADEVSLNTVGDHSICYNDTEVEYTREVYVWQTGNATATAGVDSRDLVRSKKLSNDEAKDTPKAGIKGADFNEDATIDGADVYCMRRLLVGDEFTFEKTLSEKLLGEGKKNVMPILGYYGPSPAHSITAADGNEYWSRNTVTKDMYALIQELGINLVAKLESTAILENPNSYLSTKEQLDLAAQYGLSLFVNDGRLSGDVAPTSEELQKKLDLYSNHSAFAGLFLIDEPSSSVYHTTGTTDYTMDNYAALSKALSKTSDMVGYANLLPYWEGLAVNGTASYQSYLNEYIEKYNPQYLSFDYYLFGKTEKVLWWDEELTVADGEEFMQNLAMIRSAAKEKNIPFWSYVQAGENWNDDMKIMESTRPNDTPSEGEFKWQANIALAFGAQGLSYFPLIQPHYFALTEDGAKDYSRNGLIAEDGSKNQWYGYAQKMNRQIAAVDEVLMNATNEGVIAVSGYAANVIDNSLNRLGDSNLVISSYDKLQSVTTDGSKYGAVVGCFDYQGKDAFYVVNYDVTTSRNITLKFSENVTADVTQLVADGNSQVAQTSVKTAKDIVLTLGAGEGALVVLK